MPPVNKSDVEDETEYLVTLTRSIVYLDTTIPAGATAIHMKGKVIKANLGDIGGAQHRDYPHQRCADADPHRSRRSFPRDLALV